MTALPEWITRARDWPTESSEAWPAGSRACGIGCDMGGGTPSDKHDKDCRVVQMVGALAIAWEAMVQANHWNNVDGLGAEQKLRQCTIDLEHAMRRITKLGKE